MVGRHCVVRKKRKGFLGDVPAAILVSMEIQSILIGKVINAAVILFGHGIDHFGQDLQVGVSDNNGYLVHIAAPPVYTDGERQGLFTIYTP